MSVRLTIMRHAKSDWPAGVADHDRPLTERGIANAREAGHWMNRNVGVPDLILCSSARRTRSTMREMSADWPVNPAHKVGDWLYETTPGTVLEHLQTLGADAAHILIIGHEPTMSQLSQILAGADSDAQALATLSQGFRTNGLASLISDAAWKDWETECATLEIFAVPRPTGMS